MLGKFGQMDVFDPDYANNIINPYPDIDMTGEKPNDTFWDIIHYTVGVILGQIVSETSAVTFMETWELTEPGIWSQWDLEEYQGRNIFEGGEEGIERDMNTGTAGYETSDLVIWIIYNAYNTYRWLSF